MHKTSREKVKETKFRQNNKNKNNNKKIQNMKKSGV